VLGYPRVRPGLCSVTLRALSIEDVAGAAAAAGLEAIEWGADVHVPPGDLAAARRARDAGPAVASYGSYFRAGDPLDEFERVLDTARALGAPRVRIWAGRVGSAQATAGQRAAVAEGVRAAAELAGEIEVALEFHGGTLTDDPASAVALLEAAGGARTYWQPPQGAPDDVALAGLRAVAPWLSAVHVFSWWPRDERRPLAARSALWREALALAGDVDALLEFVPGDDPAVLAREAATLRALGA
jgi:3-dehydroshikimate dehydratase